MKFLKLELVETQDMKIESPIRKAAIIEVSNILWDIKDNLQELIEEGEEFTLINNSTGEIFEPEEFFRAFDILECLKADDDFIIDLKD